MQWALQLARHLAAYLVFQQQQLPAARVPQVIRTLLTVEVMKGGERKGVHWNAEEEEEPDTTTLLGCLQVRGRLLAGGGNACRFSVGGGLAGGGRKITWRGGGLQGGGWKITCRGGGGEGLQGGSGRILADGGGGMHAGGGKGLRFGGEGGGVRGGLARMGLDAGRGCRSHS